MDKIQSAKYVAILGAGLAAGHLGTSQPPNYAGVEIKEQTAVSEDAHGTDGMNPDKVTMVVKMVDANGQIRTIKIPKKDFKEVK